MSGVGGVGVHFTLVDALLGFGLVVVVPLGFGLDRLSARLGGVAALAGCAATAGLMLRHHPTVAVALGLPWLVLALAAALLAVRRWWRAERGPATIGPPLAFAALAFAAAWLEAELAGARPFGVGPPFVELVAVHFSYAGFVAGMLVTIAARRLPASPPARAAAVLVLGGPPVVAAGFQFVPALLVVGALSLTVGLGLLSWVTARAVVPAAGDRLAAALLAASSAAILVPMLEAVWWALGATAGLPAPSVAVMARTHGVTNAVGFAFLGVLGWRRLQRQPVRGPVG